jgi:hypothetical protein
MTASHALSQLSYGPDRIFPAGETGQCAANHRRESHLKQRELSQFLIVIVRLTQAIR